MLENILEYGIFNLGFLIIPSKYCYCFHENMHADPFLTTCAFVNVSDSEAFPLISRFAGGIYVYMKKVRCFKQFGFERRGLVGKCLCF